MSHLELQDILAPYSPWLNLVVCEENRVDRVGYTVNTDEYKRAQVICRFIRGKNCTDKPRMLQEWSAALQFPWYFGCNWDAFEECINDLEWLPGNAYVFFISQLDRVVPDDDASFRTLLSILRGAAREWATPASRPAGPKLARPPIPFRVVFQSEPVNEAQNRQRLATTDYARWTL